MSGMNAWKVLAVALGVSGLTVGFVAGRVTAPPTGQAVQVTQQAPATAPMQQAPEQAVPQAEVPTTLEQLTTEQAWAASPTLPELVTYPNLIGIMLQGAPQASDAGSMAAWPDSLDFATLSRNPNRHRFTPANMSGTVDQIIEEDNGVTHLRVSLRSYGRDTIWVTTQHPVDAAIRDDSRVRVYGRVLGAYTYRSQAQHEITIPAVLASVVTLRR